MPDKDIWSWTGYTWEEMMLETPDKLELLSLIDILVDGRYEMCIRDRLNQGNYAIVRTDVVNV